MTLTEKTAYIKGLCEGLEFDKKDSAEAKIIKALLDLCSDMAEELSELFSFNVPQRWSIAHLYRTIKRRE